MAEQLGDVEQRLDSMDQLSSVVSAIRGIAAARLREADERLEGIRSYAETVGKAIGRILNLFPAETGRDAGAAASGARLVIALCSEQGFVGGFNAHVLDAARDCVSANPQGSETWIIGDRGMMLAREHGLEPAWSAPMAARADEVMTLANRLAEALYVRIRQGAIDSVSIVQALPARGEAQTVRRNLIPFDYDRFPAPAGLDPPLLNLPPADLLAAMAEEYVFAELCEALMLSFAAESEARMFAMLAAHENVNRRLEELTALARRVRQEEITAEVIELAAAMGSTAT